MSKKKRTGSNPLNDLLPQIQDTRENKEEVEEIKEDIKANSEEISKSDAGADGERKQNNQESAQETAEEGIQEQESSPPSPSSEAESDTSSIITIPKKIKTMEYVRMTHYFRPDQLKELDKLHKQSGRDKSELVRLAVDILIEQAKIE